MCNNSIKRTSLCFHKVRHTQRHPLEFHILLLAPWTHPKEYCSVGKVTNTVCVCLLIITFLTKTYPGTWIFCARSICSHVIRRGCTELIVHTNLIKETAESVHANIKVLINKKGKTDRSRGNVNLLWSFSSQTVKMWSNLKIWHARPSIWPNLWWPASK